MIQSIKLQALYGKFKTNMLYKFIRMNAVESLGYLTVKTFDKIILDSVSIKEHSETGCLVQDTELDRKHLHLDWSVSMPPTSIVEI
jgi:hypothetical protein